MVKLFHAKRINLSKKKPEKSIAKEVLAILKEKGIEKSEIGLIIHSGVYKINFRAEPAFASNIQKHMGLGDNTVSSGSTHAFSFDIVDGRCGSHHAIQVINDIFDTFNSSYAILVVSDERPNSKHKDGNFETGFVMIFSSEGNFELVNSEFSQESSHSAISHAIFDGKEHVEMITGEEITTTMESSESTFSADSKISSAEQLGMFFDWCRNKTGALEHIIYDTSGKTSKLCWRVIIE